MHHSCSKNRSLAMMFEQVWNTDEACNTVGQYSEEMALLPMDRLDCFFPQEDSSLHFFKVPHLGTAFTCFTNRWILSGRVRDVNCFSFQKLRDEYRENCIVLMRYMLRSRNWRCARALLPTGTLACYIAETDRWMGCPQIGDSSWLISCAASRRNEYVRG
jgi:hypothetical protein